jgi:adenylate cyclase class 2
MAQETEIKLRIADLRAFQKKLQKLGAKAAFAGIGRVHEENLIFDTPEGGLAKHGQLLRVRTETPELAKKSQGQKAARVVLTFKRPPEGVPARFGEAGGGHRHKVREEIEVEVADSGPLTKIFEGLGMRGWFRYEKYRTTFKLGAAKKWAAGLLVEVDETPIGAFVELEGPGEAIDRAAQEFGYSKKDYVVRSYLSLYLDDCRRRGEQPSDMVFQKRKAAAK